MTLANPGWPDLRYPYCFGSLRSPEGDDVCPACGGIRPSYAIHRCDETPIPSKDDDA